jgi:hypothetical protein
MDEGTYSDPEVARLIDRHFIAIKVDRDEHPEVDRRYQRQVNALTGEGGWPLTAFLTPQGDVFLGGTYFPPLDAIGRPGFRRVLKEVARLWQEEPERVHQNASAIRDAIARVAPGPPNGTALPELRLAVREEVLSSYDPVNGGFGPAPKFPHPTAVSYLLLEAYRSSEPTIADPARVTLERMADGGMYDQLAGGFHRYSVDEGWHIPHFEKMGVDNAALLSAYVEGARRFALPRFTEVLRGTIDWTVRVLGDPAGGFGSSQDADNAPGDDGSYFTWSRAELKAALDPREFHLVHRFFGVGGDGRMPHDPDRNVLFRPLPLADAIEGLGIPLPEAEETLRTAVAKLSEVRARRATPVIDRALYTHINGAFVRALAQAGQFLEEESVVGLARRTADRFIAEGYRPGSGLAHRIAPSGATGFGLLDDQAEFALGLIELGAATVEPRYLRVAEELLETVLREFPGAGGLLRDVAPSLYDGPTVAALEQPSYPLEDSPHLAANSATVLALLRLAALTNEERWRSAARALLDALSVRLQHAGLFAAGAALAAGLFETAPVRAVIEGRGAEADALYRAAVRSWTPIGFVFRGTPPPPFSLPDELGASEGATPRALVCYGTRCLAPITEPEKVASALSVPPS